MTTKKEAVSVPVSREFQASGFVPPPPPASLFQGCGTVVGSGVSTAVVGSSVTTGGASSVVYHVTEDVESLYRALNVSQSLSVGFGPFGSVNEKSQFVQNLSLTSHSLNIVVHATHVKGTETANAFRLQDGIVPPVGNDQLSKFFRSYGDSFVSALTMGAEYYAVYTFYAQSQEEQTSVKAELAANGVFDFGTVGADFQTKLDIATRSTHTRISFSQNVAGIANPKLPTTAELVKYALDFPSLPIDAPSILSFATTGYEHVPGVDGFGPIAKNRDYFLGNRATPGLANELASVVELKNQLGWLQRLYSFYRGFVDSKAKEAQEEAQKDEAAVNQQITKFNDDPTATFQRPPLNSLTLGSPVLAYQIVPTDAHGGDGGDPFDDVDINTYLQRQTYITAIQLRSGSEVDALITSYRDVDNNGWTTIHGGGGGGLSQKLTVMPGQFVSRITGRSGTRVDQLGFTLTDGRTVAGGGSGGGPFDWTATGADLVLGFSGRSGSRLDKFQPVVARLQPAKWNK
jgi:hypothetical protein